MFRVVNRWTVLTWRFLMFRVVNRWTVLTGAMLVQIFLGGIYSWSVFVQPLEELGFSRTQTQMVFSCAFAIFSIAMIFAGKLQDRAGPRKVAIAGGTMLGLGYIIVGVFGANLYGTSLFHLTMLSIGLLSGAGMGIAYVCPVAAAIKWFPDKKGLITGITVAGFGGGSFLFAKIASALLPSVGLMNTFLAIGALFLTAIVLGASLLVNPPTEWAQKFSIKKTKLSNAINFSWHEMVRTKEFWILWILFGFSASSGLMVVGNIKPFGINHGVDAATAASAIGILAIFNAAGRIAWGCISDRIGRKQAILMMVALQGTVMMILTQIQVDAIVLMVTAACIGFNFGGNFALFPTATADFFGIKNLGVNYGLMITSFGTAAVGAPIMVGYVFDTTGSYTVSFITGGCLCWAAAAISLTWILKDKKPALVEDKLS